MNLSEISIRRPVLAWMLMAGLLVFGSISYMRMGTSELPDVDFPVVSITVSWAGAAPSVMETAVADVVESAVMSVDGIQRVESTSQQGQAEITIKFALGQDINVALQQVQAKVSEAQRNLPQTIDPPIITKSNPNDEPILFAAATAPGGTLRDLSLFVRDHLKDTLTTVNGVGDVSTGGYIAPQMRIWLSADKMAHYELTANDIIAAVANEHQLATTGFQDTEKTETFVRLHSEFGTTEECNNLIIPARISSPIFSKLRIRDVANCEEATDEVRRLSRFDGVFPTIGIGVIKQRGTNAVAIADAVKEKIKTLSDTLPKGFRIGMVTDSTVFIRDSIHELNFTLLLAVLLTSFVCYLFLGSFSSALNVIMAIPVSLVGTFIVLHALGFTINTFTLLGLTLCIGIVVDDAIMVLENITRHNELGKDRIHAALVGSREVTGAAVASSLAILAIFVPVVFMSGIVGKFFFQFGVTMSVAVLISLLEALTLAPMRCAQFLAVGSGNVLTRQVSRLMDSLERAYRRGLNLCLHNTRSKVTVLVVAFTFFGASLFLVSGLRSEFLPPQDQSHFLVTVHTKMGSSLTSTDLVFKEAEKIYQQWRDAGIVENYYISVGGFGAGGMVNEGMSYVTLKPVGERGIAPPFKKRPTQQEFMQVLRGQLEKIAGVERVALMDLSLNGFSGDGGYPIEFVLQGPDWQKLADLSIEMRRRMKDSKLMADVDSDYDPNMPETEIYPDREKASQRLVPITEIAQEVSALVGGLKLLPNKYTDASGHRDDIQLKLVADDNRGTADINKIGVRNTQGEIVSLGSLITLKNDSTLLTVTRYNRERGIQIFGNFAPGRSQSEVMTYIRNLAKELLPAGYHVTMSGSSEAFTESMESLIGALLLGIFVSYMVLASQFNSFIHPGIILLALPFSLTGAFLAMRLTDTSINIYSLIGILLLMGIVKKNSILLVEFTNHKRATGISVREALLGACPVRLRPILMTSIATIAGAIPAAFVGGVGSEVTRPMAITVLGGVAVSTLFTLFVVPCAYALTARFESRKYDTELKSALKLLAIPNSASGAHHGEAEELAYAIPAEEMPGSSSELSH